MRRLSSCVYREVAVLQNDAASDAIPAKLAIVSYDEKPGIQAISNTAPDLPPEPGSHAAFARDHEYRRRGTLSLLAALGELPPAEAVACATGNTARVYKLDRGVIAEGREAETDEQTHGSFESNPLALARIVPRRERAGQSERECHHQRFVPGADERSGIANDGDRGTPGAGRSRLARTRRRVHVRSGSHRRRELACLAPRCRTGTAVRRRTISVRSITCRMKLR